MKVKFTGCSKEQVGWGSNVDPNGILTIGETYTVKRTETHTWHTKIELEEFPGKLFNKICFETIWKDG